MIRDNKSLRLHFYGEIMRFITPILVSVALFMLNGIDKRVEKLENLGERVAKIEAVQHVERTKR